MKNYISRSFIKILKSCLPVTKIKIGLHEPSFNGNEWSYIKECLDTGWVSYVGKYVNKFELMLAEFTRMKYAIAVVNGTTALHISLLLSGVKSNEEVLAPALTFIAPVNAISYCGAIPHFVDSDEKTLGIDPVKLSDYLKDIAVLKGNVCYNRKTKRRISAMIPVHTFGHPVDLDKLLAICQHYKLTMIEDAAEAIGSYYKGKHVGHWGKLATLSFNGNKIITTGGGGAILTNDKSLTKTAKHITTTAKLPHMWKFFHDKIGYNYRLPNINAALGCAQLEQLPKFLKKKRALAKKYEKAFKNTEGMRFFVEPKFAQSNYWINVIILDKNFSNQRDKLLKSTNSAGIMTRPAWTLMPKLPMYKKCPSMNLSVAENLEKRIINIPSSASLI